MIEINNGIIENDLTITKDVLNEFLDKLSEIKQINGFLYLSHLNLNELPNLSNITINGNFTCSDNKLTTLKNCPNKVNGGFFCHNNCLNSLKFFPQELNGGFYCHYNNLTTLIGCPNEINGDFQCRNNNLTSLKGCPIKINGHFGCNNNKLTSLKNGPKEVNGNFHCYGNKLESLINETKYSGFIYLYKNIIKEIPINELLKINSTLPNTNTNTSTDFLIKKDMLPYLREQKLIKVIYGF